MWFVSEYSLAPPLTQDVHIKGLFVTQLIASGHRRVIWDFLGGSFYVTGYNFPDDTE